MADHLSQWIRRRASKLPGLWFKSRWARLVGRRPPRSNATSATGGGGPGQWADGSGSTMNPPPVMADNL